MTPLVKIAKDSFGATHVWVDDFDVSRACFGYVLSHPKPDQVPTLELRLAVHEIELVGEADVWISKDAQELLVRFGWTPPPEPDITKEG